MIRFLLFLLLTVVALSQVVPRQGFNADDAGTELEMIADEGENEKAEKPDVKSHGDDKVHHEILYLYNFLDRLSGNLTPHVQQLYSCFYGQPNTPPPNFS